MVAILTQYLVKPIDAAAALGAQRRGEWALAGLRDGVADGVNLTSPTGRVQNTCLGMGIDQGESHIGSIFGVFVTSETNRSNSGQRARRLVVLLTLLWGGNQVRQVMSTQPLVGAPKVI